MSAKVHLQIKSGPQDGHIFTFEEHDTFIFGRMEDCHACIPGDNEVSRHHFILEVNPPHACLRDLGSLNGTQINGKKCGGRAKHETPEQGAKRSYLEVTLRHGDVIQVGKTKLEVTITVAKEPPKHKAAPALVNLDELPPAQLAKILFEGKPGQTPLLTLPGYRIRAEIGRGGFGAVYRARREKDNANVAIKIMTPREDTDDTAVEKFRREVAITAGLQHAHIVQVLDRGSSGSIFYFVMEYCDGGSVWDFLRKNGGKLPLAQAKSIILQSLEGLAHAHAQGIIHRDLKPQNILLNAGRARISDFGLSKSFQQAGLSGMSITGNYAGTPLFMPREQITNFKYLKPQTDVWSMAATIYHILTGAFPYPFVKGRDPIDIMLNELVVPIAQRDKSLPKRLCAVLDKALSKNPQDRYPSATELLTAMQKALA